MSGLIFEGFDGLQTSDLANLNGFLAASLAFTSVAVGAGRFGGNALSVTEFNQPGLNVLLPPATTSLVFGMALKLSGTLNTTCGILEVVPATGGGVNIGVNAAGQLFFANSGTIFATSTASVQSGAWNYVEVSIVLGASAVMRLNTINVISYSGNVGAGATGYQSLNFNGNMYSNLSALFDDFYCIPVGAGSSYSTFLGDCRVISRLPTNNQQSQWAPLTGTSNVAMIQENPEDGDTTYNSSATPGQQDFYSSTVALPGAPSQVFAVNTSSFARKDDAGTRQIANVIKSGTSTAQGATDTLNTGAAYTRYTDSFEVDPATSAAWSPAAAVAVEFGPLEVA